MVFSLDGADDAGATFGFWLNNPAMGGVDFDATDDSNRTMHWQLAAAAQLDYIVTTTSSAAMTDGTSAFELLEHFVSWVGRSPGLPDWALGYWHCKNRYASQVCASACACAFVCARVPLTVCGRRQSCWQQRVARADHRHTQDHRPAPVDDDGQRDLHVLRQNCLDLCNIGYQCCSLRILGRAGCVFICLHVDTWSRSRDWVMRVMHTVLTARMER